MRVVNRGMAGSASIRARGKDSTIGPQHRGPNFVRSCVCSTAGVPQLRNRASGARPCPHGWVIDLGVRAGSVVLEDVRVYSQHLSVGQQSPPFLVIDVELPRPDGGPGQVRRIKQCLLLRTAVGLHVRSVRQDHRLSIADSSPTGGGLDGGPRILQRIVNSALVSPDCITASRSAVVFSALGDHTAVGQHAGTKIEGSVAVGERGDLGPGAMDVTAVAIRRKLVPGTVVCGRAGETVWF